MEAALKQRLIGASVIIALAIIFVPMLFNNEPQQKAKSISIEIPQKPDTDLETKTFSLDDPVVKLPPADVELQESGNNNPVLRPIESTVVETQPQTNDVAEETPPVTTAQTESEEPQLTDIQVEVPSTETSQPDNVQQDNSQADTTSVAAVEQTPLPEASPTTTQNTSSQPASVPLAYRIKLGSFSQKANAEKLKATLLQSGIRSAVSLDPGKKLYRVWSEQSYSNRSAADQYISEVNKLKLNIGEPKVIEMDAADISAVRDSSTLGWVIQLGSFSKKENAIDLRNRLRLQKYDSFVDQTSNAANQKRYRVRIGPFLQKGDAESTNKNIKTKLQLDGLIKAHDLSPVVD